MSFTVNIYNFSGAISKPLSIAWLINATDSAATPATTFAPTNNVTPFKFSIPNNYSTYIFWYYQTDIGSYLTLKFNTSGEANIYLLNNPSINFPNGPLGNYNSINSGIDSSYIIYGTSYQPANTYNYPLLYLGLSVPAVSQADMQQLTLVNDVFTVTTPTGNPPLRGGNKPVGKLPTGGGSGAPSSSTNNWYWLVIVIMILNFLVVLGGGLFYLVKDK